MKPTGEAAFETVIEAHLLSNGYVRVAGEHFDRERAIFPADVALDFIRETQPAEWGRLGALLGEKTGEQVLTDLCRWMDANGSLATLRHGFNCIDASDHRLVWVDVVLGVARDGLRLPAPPLPPRPGPRPAARSVVRRSSPHGTAPAEERWSAAVKPPPTRGGSNMKMGLFVTNQQYLGD